MLKDARLVIARAEGTRRVYRLDPAGLEALRSYLDGFWESTLDEFKRAAEAAARKKKGARK